LEKVGGSSNAFTSPDITNYYITLPAINLETAFWLESDRMMSLLITEKTLEVQRKVVIEEFKQRYLNQPYGDVWIHLRSLAYKVHPYRWQTIGRDISHIEQATLADVQTFFQKYYCPNNAIMVVAGNVRFSEVVRLAEKWFADIPMGEVPARNLPQEPIQTEARFLEVEADVPASVIYKSYHTVPRNHPDYYATDVLSNLLGGNKSSRLYETLVKKQKIFTSVGAFISGSLDTGLFTISGRLNKNVSLQEADRAIEQLLAELQDTLPPQERELQKIKNQAETDLELSETELLTRAMNLAFMALLGDTQLVNREKELLQAVTQEKVHQLAKGLLQKERCSTLYYKARA
ncbi:MAG: insulinase family protein, partial [Flammeovirgaceae bacterium]|nr:insulinase family protein [Flammeovirgaceae bacterium]MDW8288919.1 pitrilysin family protein [Flammeovirgaceae bacterium]